MTEKKQLSRRAVLRFFGIAGIGLTSLSQGISIASAQNETSQTDLQGAGFYRFKLGEFECVVVSDGFIQMKPSEFFINPPLEIEKALKEHFLPTDKITLQINTLVVKNGKNTVLMDSGIGNAIGATGGHLFANLKRAGISPDEITDVFLSHTHFDHIGGNFSDENRLNFPNATFHLSQTEWTAAIEEKNFFGDLKTDEQLKKLILDAIRKNVVPLKDRVKLFKTDSEILPGISALTAYGHTPGHSTYLIKSGAESLLYAGDLIHHVIQLDYPQIQMNGNSFIKQATESRQKVLNRVAAEKIKMMTAHFPYPGIGNLRVRNPKTNSFEWIPIEWQW